MLLSFPLSSYTMDKNKIRTSSPVSYKSVYMCVEESAADKPNYAISHKSESIVEKQERNKTM